jgi:transposase
MYSDDIGIKGEFKKYDSRIREVMDLNDIEGRKVMIRIHQRRFTCPNCGKIFTEYFQSVCRRDKVTARLWERLGKEMLEEKDNTFRMISRRYGVSPTTVARAFKDYVAQLDKQRILKAPKVLGIDEVYAKFKENKKKIPLAVFTDNENHKILEIINGNSFDQIVAVLQSMIGYESIEAVTMDMNTTYRSAVKAFLPNAYCVIDHYHVIQKLDLALDSIRAAIQSKLPDGQKDDLYHVKDSVKKDRNKLTESQMAKLDAQLELYPKLNTCYWLKEHLRDVYQCTDKKEAYGKYYEWECEVDETAKRIKIPEIQGVQRMINKMKHQVFNYFDSRYTNGFTERFNRDVKDMIRDGNGYEFDTLRAKVLYGTSATAMQIWKNTNFVRIQNILYDTSNMYEYAEPNKLIHGFEVDIQQLCEAIERGEI